MPENFNEGNENPRALELKVEFQKLKSKTQKYK